MSKQFYRKTKKLLLGWRELDDYERVKPSDIIWSCTSRRLTAGTSNPIRLLRGEAVYMQIHPQVLKGLTNARACEIVDLFAAIHGPMIGEMVAKRKYSLWRKQMVLPPKPEMKALPLP